MIVLKRKMKVLDLIYFNKKRPLFPLKFTGGDIG